MNYLFYIRVPGWRDVYRVHAGSVLSGQNWVLEALELELRVVVSSCVNAGNRTLALCRAGSFHTTEPPLQPFYGTS